MPHPHLRPLPSLSHHTWHIVIASECVEERASCPFGTEAPDQASRRNSTTIPIFGLLNVAKRRISRECLRSPGLVVMESTRQPCASMAAKSSASAFMLRYFLLWDSFLIEHQQSVHAESTRVLNGVETYELVRGAKPRPEESGLNSGCQLGPPRLFASASALAFT